MTVWPGQEVTYSFIPDGPEHDAERCALAAMVGEPVPFDDDPAVQEKGDKLATEWLERTTRDDR